MPRTTTLVAVPATVALGLLAPTAASAAPATQQPSARLGSCQRTLAHYPVLHPGDRRPAVRTLQCALNDAGYRPVAVDGWYGPRRGVLTVDGSFGRRTRLVVRQYQRSQSFHATGVVNERTRFFLAMGGVLHGLN
jgi:peptidoglycan hydrolase-like protein with peptidoglycan-binding domain